MFRTLADLKRAPIGTELYLVETLLGPVPSGPLQYRKIAIVQTNAIAFSRDPSVASDRLSWLFFPKARFFEFHDRGFVVREEDGGRIAASYLYRPE
jgi:hypothetical protein